MEIGQRGLAGVTVAQDEGVFLVHFVLVFRRFGRRRHGRTLEARAALRQWRPSSSAGQALLAARVIPARLDMVAAPPQRLVLELARFCAEIKPNKALG